MRLTRGWFQVSLLLFLLVLGACSNPQNAYDQHFPLTQPDGLVPVELAVGETVQIVATTSIIGDVVTNLCGDQIDLTVLIPRGTDPHAYQPTPGDLQALYQADLVLLNGFGLEANLEDELAQVGENVPLISLSEGISPRTLEAHDQEDEHAEGIDPHVWFDPNLILHWVQRTEQALIQLDPDHSTSYRENAERYRTELDALDGWIQEQVASIPVDQRKLVLDHLVMGYFADRYGFEVISALVPGFSSAAEPSPRELAGLSEIIQAESVPAIFVGVDTNPRLAEQLADDLGVKVVMLYTGSLSKVGGPAATYLEMMQYNVLAIRGALTP